MKFKFYIKKSVKKISNRKKAIKEHRNLDIIYGCSLEV